MWPVKKGIWDPKLKFTNIKGTNLKLLIKQHPKLLGPYIGISNNRAPACTLQYSDPGDDMNYEREALNWRKCILQI